MPFTTEAVFKIRRRQRWSPDVSLDDRVLPPDFDVGDDPWSLSARPSAATMLKASVADDMRVVGGRAGVWRLDAEHGGFRIPPHERDAGRGLEEVDKPPPSAVFTPDCSEDGDEELIVVFRRYGTVGGE